jgi:hypothetical protein
MRVKQRKKQLALHDEDDVVAAPDHVERYLLDHRIVRATAIAAESA